MFRVNKNTDISQNVIESLSYHVQREISVSKKQTKVKKWVEKNLFEIKVFHTSQATARKNPCFNTLINSFGATENRAESILVHLVQVPTVREVCIKSLFDEPLGNIVTGKPDSGNKNSMKHRELVGKRNPEADMRDSL